MTDLDHRTGLPSELLAGLAAHPRAHWREGVPPLARFWLDKHAWLRRQAEAIARLHDEHREGRLPAEAQLVRAMPALQRFLGELDGHHRIEDEHYFPNFVRAAPELAHGFALLGADHRLVHEALARLIAAIDASLRCAAPDAAGPRVALDAAVAARIDAFELLHRRTSRHLDDEEDLLIPVLIDRGE